MTNVFSSELNFDAQAGIQDLRSSFLDGFATVVSNSLNIAPSCPTGNYTFPEYRSLGISSRCHEITSTIESNCPGNSVPLTAERNCSFLLPSGFFVNFSPTSGNADGLQLFGALGSIGCIAKDAEDIPNFACIEMISLSNTPNSIDDHEFLSAKAYRCDLAPNINT